MSKWIEFGAKHLNFQLGIRLSIYVDRGSSSLRVESIHNSDFEMRESFATKPEAIARRDEIIAQTSYTSVHIPLIEEPPLARRLGLSDIKKEPIHDFKWVISLKETTRVRSPSYGSKAYLVRDLKDIYTTLTVRQFLATDWEVVE